jgi:hypothetical protein
MKRKLLLAGALIVVLVLSFFGPGDDEPALPMASASRVGGAVTEAAARPRSNGSNASNGSSAVDILELKPRLEPSLLSGTLFVANVPAPSAKAAAEAAAAAAPPAPVIVPVPYVFLGKTLVSGKVEVFLGKGDAVLIARESEVLDGAWRVDQIKPPHMRLTYLPLKQENQISIGAFE